MSQKIIRISLGIIQAFIAISAIPAGIMLILEPGGSTLGLPLEDLSLSPFSNYFIPGLFLLVVNGVGNLVASLFTFRKNSKAKLLGICLGFILVIWILIQLYFIGGGSFLQPMYLIIGIIEIILAFFLRNKG